jgi:hypothetical protein
MQFIDEARKQAFLLDLRRLMKDYQVTIGFNCSPCSDTHGISEGRIEVCLGKEVVLAVHNWWMDFNDLEN